MNSKNALKLYAVYRSLPFAFADILTNKHLLYRFDFRRVFCHSLDKRIFFCSQHVV